MILEAEVEPLEIAISVRVVAHENIECVGIPASDLLNIGTLKVTIKCHKIVEDHWLSSCIQWMLVDRLMQVC